MTGTRPLAWSDGRWSRAPVTEVEVGEALRVRPQSHAEFWRTTGFGGISDDGHALLRAWDRTCAVQVDVRVAESQLDFDQAGLMVRASPTHWIKSGIEIIDGQPYFMSTVTTGTSDASVSRAPIEVLDRGLTVRVSLVADVVVIRMGCKTDGGVQWQTMRFLPLPISAGVEAGPFVCAPSGEGLLVEFRSWAESDPDLGLHPTDPSRR